MSRFGRAPAAARSAFAPFARSCLAAGAALLLAACARAAPGADSAAASVPPAPAAAADTAFAGAGDPVPASRADSTFARAELGSAYETSNEQFYEDTYTDTTFLGRRLLGTPETHAGAVFSAEMGAIRDGGALEVLVRPDLTLLSGLTRASTSLMLRTRSESGWRTTVEPAFEFERDLSYGLDRRELRGRLSARARRPLGDGLDALEVHASGELLDTGGTSDPYLLSHRVATAGLGWDHVPLYGWEAHVDGGAAVRTFPDSTERDHLEPQLELTLRRDLEGGHSLLFTAEAERRSTLHPVSDTRDRFLSSMGRGELQLRVGDETMLSLVLEAEDMRYDAPDSVVDFDYAVGRARATLRREWGVGWTASVGPAAERLVAPLSPGETYGEIAGVLEVERIAGGGWWLLSPSGGWRGYDHPESNGVYSPDALHSSYAFAEAHAIADQPLPARLRLRAIADARLERHTDNSQDSQSLYFSLDLRRLF